MSQYIYSLLLLGILGVSPAFADTKTDTKKAAAAPSPTLTLTVGQYSDTVSPDVISSWTLQSGILEFSNTKTEFENAHYCPLQSFVCELTRSSRSSAFIHLTQQKTIDNQAIHNYVEDLARKVNRDPQDAKFMVQDGKVSTFSEAQDGITLNIDASTSQIKDALANLQGSQTINLSFESKKADVNYADVNSMGISALIGEGTSNFKGSPANRIRNIKVATERFNGLLIKPGEEFSFVKNLGEVDGDHGYLPELVIKKDKTEPEFGGGICQVSSTAFRAAIYSGLKITARRNHAYPVSYYNPQGMDATVYVPQPDLRFKNNTPGYILIQTKIVGTQLTFDFYGTSDGRKITVDGPTITERQPDGSLKATFTQHVFDKDGNEYIDDVFNSAYDSPYRYPHPGGPILTAKPANWSDDEWKAYKKMAKDIAKAEKTN